MLFHTVRALFWQKLKCMFAFSPDEITGKKVTKYSVAQKLMHHAMTLMVLAAVITGCLMLMKMDTPLWKRDPYTLSQATWGVIYVDPRRRGGFGDHARVPARVLRHSAREAHVPARDDQGLDDPRRRTASISEPKRMTDITELSSRIETIERGYEYPAGLRSAGPTERPGFRGACAPRPKCSRP